MPGFAGVVGTYGEGRKSITWVAAELSAPGKRKRNTSNNMERQCKQGLGVEGAEGGRRERPEQVASTHTLQDDHVR